MSASVDKILRDTLQSVRNELQQPIGMRYRVWVCEGDGFLDDFIHCPDAGLREAYQHGIFSEYSRAPSDDDDHPSRGVNYFVYWLMRQVSAQFGSCYSNYKGPHSGMAEFSTEARFSHDAKGMTPLMHNVELFKLFELDDWVRLAQGKQDHLRGDVDDRRDDGLYVKRPKDRNMHKPNNPTVHRAIYRNVNNVPYEPVLYPDWIHENVFSILGQCYPPVPDIKEFLKITINGETRIATLNPARGEQVGDRMIWFNTVVENTQHAYRSSFNGNIPDENQAFASKVHKKVAIRYEEPNPEPKRVYAPAQCVIQRVFNFTKHPPYVAFAASGLATNLFVYYNYLREYIRAEMCVRYIFILQLIDRASAAKQYSSFPGLSHGFKLAREVRLCIESVLAMNWQNNSMFRGSDSWVAANQRITGCNYVEAQRRVLCFIIWRNLWHFNELYKDRFGENIVDTVASITPDHYKYESSDAYDDWDPIYLYKNIIFGYNRAVSLMCYDHYMQTFDDVLDIQIVVGNTIDFRGNDFGFDKTPMWQVGNFFNSLKFERHETVYQDAKRQRILRTVYKQPFLVEFEEFVSVFFKKHVRQLALSTHEDLPPGIPQKFHFYMGIDIVTQLSQLLRNNWLVPVPTGTILTVEDLQDQWEEELEEQGNVY